MIKSGATIVDQEWGHDCGAGGETAVHDQFDVTLEDADLLGEVELTTNLIIAASEAEEHLSSAEIDRILGVTPLPGNVG